MLQSYDVDRLGRRPGRTARVGWKHMNKPNLIVLISRGLGFDKLHIKAKDLQVKNSTIIVTDVHGEAHYIPKAMWHSLEVKQSSDGEVAQGAT